jgi:hypothetical protein
MLVGMAKVFAIAGLLMWGLLAFLLAMQGDWHAVAPMGLMIAAAVCGLAVVGALAATLVYRNRVRMRFTLDDEAATAQVIDNRVRTVNRLAILVGSLIGKPGAVGAGVLGEANKTTLAVWSAIAFVRPHPRWKAIALGNAWRTTLVLFCRSDNYEAVLAQVMAAHAAHATRVRSNPLPRLLLRTVLASLASATLFFLPFKHDPFVPFLMLCFALSSVWLIPSLAWVVLAALAWIAFECVMSGAMPYQSAITHEVMRTYELLNGDDIGLIALAFLGSVYLAWLSYELLTGGVESGLAGDLLEAEGIAQLSGAGRRPTVPG